MAKKPGTNPKGEFAFFNVFYEDGSQRSNRRVPSELLGGLDGDEPARGFIMEQDREIAEKSGRAPLAIKGIARIDSDEAIHASIYDAMDCFAEPVIGRAFARPVGSQ